MTATYIEKPNWNSAPEWANYLAQDENGDWYWYEDQPEAGYNQWYTRSGRSREAAVDWKTSLETRPKS